MFYIYNSIKLDALLHLTFVSLDIFFQNIFELSPEHLYRIAVSYTHLTLPTKLEV